MSVHNILSSVIAAIGGTQRDGQVEMADAVTDALNDDAHLMVQAGTGTGKSFGYLVPVAWWASQTGKKAIISTATLALQRQITQHDAPAVLDEVKKQTKVALDLTILKGWNNYICLKKVHEDVQDALLPADAQATAMGKEVMRTRTWALESDTGDRDDLVPGVSDQVWRQVSLTKQECEGKDCPLILECFPEAARARAQEADIVITNHAMLGVEASGISILPESQAVIVDEAHELVNRVTNQLTVRIGPSDISRIARKIRSNGKLDTEFSRHGLTFTTALADLDGRQRKLPVEAREALAGMQRSLKEASDEQWSKAFRSDIELLLDEDGGTVWWVRDEALYGAPLDVAHPISSRIFSERATILTSATLQVGGSFKPIAADVGLSFPSQGPWEGLDVGSPFTYGQQGILYIASDLPAPGRGGNSSLALDRMADFIMASRGGALGLFSSRQAAENAADYLREIVDVPILCQGDDTLPTLIEEFRDNDEACLFGTMSLWQGVDIPGRTCRLVLIDRIPFPRPDDPVAQARTEMVGRQGGNGFMQISATHAAVLLAQGAGRLLRRTTDKGVVAVFDSRLATRAYGGYLRAGMPDMWPTTNDTHVLQALGRLADMTDGSEPDSDVTTSE